MPYSHDGPRPLQSAVSHLIIGRWVPIRVEQDNAICSNPGKKPQQYIRRISSGRCGAIISRLSRKDAALPCRKRKPCSTLRLSTRAKVTYFRVQQYVYMLTSHRCIRRLHSNLTKRERLVSSGKHTHAGTHTADTLDGDEPFAQTTTT